MIRPVRRIHAGALTVAFSLLVAGGCAFDTSLLDERRCQSDDDCTEPGFRCVEGICQGLGSDTGNRPDDTGSDVPDTPAIRCTDEDDDGSFAGPDCDQPVAEQDCAPFDPDVFPGALEICDGKDNDCDESPDDEDDDYVAEPCRLQDGVCEGALRPCEGGLLVACGDDDYGGDYERGDEAACDGLDNDCDGDVDEALFVDCYDGEDPDNELVDGRPCRMGRQACVDGRFPALGDEGYECVGQVLPADTEDTPLLRCDGQDNNCDGSFDEDCLCLPGETQSCYSGAPSDTALNAPCRMGVMECGDDARFGGPCLGERVPQSAETCADPGVDNDCDGDNSPSDIVGFGDSCDSGLDGACRDGVRQCVGDDLECVPLLAPTDETCANPGVDDDCNGVDDDIPGLGDSCTVTSFGGSDVFGQCRNGTFQCREDSLVCVPGATETEVCNLVDDDCDGAEDEPEDVDVLEDEANCGVCFNACEGGDSCCEGGCTDTTTSLAHCGGCGETCTAPGPDGVAACCDVAGTGTCVDVAFDEAHCGDCNTPCGGTCCDGGCTDLETDEANCGGCGIVCSGSEQCCGGSCVDTDDPDHCGVCDNTCGSDELCCDQGGLDCVAADVEGSCGGCGVTCAGGGTQPACCDQGGGVGACLDLADGDLANCGGCGVTCGGVAPVCCTTVADMGTCADSASDVNNCGGCGNTCGGTTPACCDEGGAGTCYDLDSDDANCGDCGVVCDGDDDACCDGGCRDFDTDPNHCGGCGITCGVDETCCGGFCVDLGVANEAHCGGCGVACDPFAGERCCEAGETFSCVMTSGAACP